MFLTCARSKTFCQHVAKTWKWASKNEAFPYRQTIVCFAPCLTKKHFWFKFQTTVLQNMFGFISLPNVIVPWEFKWSRIPQSQILRHSFHDTFPCNIGFTQTSSSKMLQRWAWATWRRGMHMNPAIPKLSLDLYKLLHSCKHCIGLNLFHDSNIGHSSNSTFISKSWIRAAAHFHKRNLLFVGHNIID